MFKESNLNDTKVTDIQAERISYSINYQGIEKTTEEITKSVKADFVAAGNSENDIKSMELSIKPAEYAVFYIINNSYVGRIAL